MTDNEIIKALEWCNSLSKRCGNGCPYYEIPYKNGKRCSEMMIDDAIDLINKQKSEIEKKTTQCERLEIYMDELVKQKLNQSKSEARKEFAERLKEGEVYMRIDFPNTECGTETYIVLSEDIDNLLKEMEVENND